MKKVIQVHGFQFVNQGNCFQCLADAHLSSFSGTTNLENRVKQVEEFNEFNVPCGSCFSVGMDRLRYGFVLTRTETQLHQPKSWMTSLLRLGLGHCRAQQLTSKITEILGPYEGDYLMVMVMMLMM